MRRSIPTYVPGEPVPLNPDPDRNVIRIHLVALTALMVVSCVLGLAMGLGVSLLNSPAPDGPRATPGRGVSTYGPPAAESHVVG